MKIKQIIALVVVVALLMAGSVLVTFAYLTRQESVLNTFTVGNITMKLDEADVDIYGVQEKDAEGKDLPRTEEGNKYKLIPGHTYTKDPTVTIGAKSEPCYVRMLVTVTDYADLCTVLAGENNINIVEQDGNKVFLLQNFVNGWEPSNWAYETVKITGEGEAQTAIYEFRYTMAVDASESEQAIVLDALFDEFEIDNGILADNLAKLEGMTIKIEAQAIQTDGFNNNAQAAWATLPY